ncbi:FAD dependent oxidoreductase-domain-containing protein [Aspergillus karnatakaensis]|uniref:FAD dependent oxidoreductase-domain-containing protein n=1 Tax=Aspergillus karnatakaensis TaxID=1810916 RepID=UPI003CCCBBB6
MSPSSLEKKKRIVIVGAGAFGLSTALHLQRHHKHDIDVLLVDSQPFPSVDSASGNDTSRQIRMDYPDSFYANLARQAIQAWKTDPVFSSHWRQSGRVGAAAPGSPYLERCRNTLREAGVEIQEFNGDGGKDNKTKELQKVFPMLGNPDLLKGWDFYFTPVCIRQHSPTFPALD